MNSLGVLKSSIMSYPSEYERKFLIFPSHLAAEASIRGVISSTRVNNTSGLCLGMKTVSKLGYIHMLVVVINNEPREILSPSETFSTMGLNVGS